MQIVMRASFLQGRFCPSQHPSVAKTSQTPWSRGTCFQQNIYLRPLHSPFTRASANDQPTMIYPASQSSPSKHFPERRDLELYEKKYFYFMANMNKGQGNRSTFLHCTASPGALFGTTNQILRGMIPHHHFVLETSACHHLPLTIS